ncbi:MAG: 1-(5-phosphoribosyl)-5-[(5-phosphoribosylamino)methylideneamino] imidazole-4-carboxamide isomerase [Acidobacteriota bacterium]|nr:1-(5-phosphoribosyl)-5-[(5-phosphoribosylamino)methylideneamino] imidazole-4-carboxamide isomerase [Acidobacteriota bacterium]
MEEHMQLLPAIDLRGGQVVRLMRGDDRRRTVYDASPGNALRRYQEAGVGRIHVVDLDAAFGGAPQRGVVQALARQARDLPKGRGGIQLGGGLRDREAVEWAFAAGCERAVVTSLIVRGFDVFTDLCRRYPGRMVAALDIDGGEVRLAGWTESADRSPAALCAELADLPVAAVLVTDISRDGMMQGPNIDLACRIGDLAGAPAILSGGVRSAADLEAAARRPQIEAAIVGRALYDGSLGLDEAIAACGSAS